MSRCQFFFSHHTLFFSRLCKFDTYVPFYFFLDCSTKSRFLSLTSVDPSIKSSRKNKGMLLSIHSDLWSMGNLEFFSPLEPNLGLKFHAVMLWHYLPEYCPDDFLELHFNCLLLPNELKNRAKLS